MYQDDEKKKELSNKINKELQDEYNKNLEIIEISEERTRMSLFNQTEHKLGSILLNSIIPYIGLVLTATLSTTIIGPVAVANIINPLSIPAILATYSLGIGTTINVIVEKQNNIKKRIKDFSKAKTEIQKIEEQIYYAIELEKTKNRNNAIKMAQTQNELNYYNINEKANISDNNPHKLIQELKNKLDKLYQELDILSTKKVLSEKFLRIRDMKQIKIDKFLVPIAISNLSYGLFSHMLIIYRDVITYSSTFTSLLPVLIPITGGALGGSIYWKIRSNNQKQAFNYFNEQLGEFKLDDIIEDIYRERKELTTKIAIKTRDVSITILKLEEQIQILNSNKTPEEQKLEHLNSLKRILETPNYDPIKTEKVIKELQKYPELQNISSILTKDAKIYQTKEFIINTDEIPEIKLPSENKNNKQLKKTIKTRNIKYKKE